MSKQKVAGFGRSLYLRFPLDWRREHGITRESIVRVVEQKNGLLIIPADIQGGDQRE